jgi:membrane-bound lytic murein transglycosylase B
VSWSIIRAASLVGVLVTLSLTNGAGTQSTNVQYANHTTPTTYHESLNGGERSTKEGSSPREERRLEASSVPSPPTGAAASEGHSKDGDDILQQDSQQETSTSSKPSSQKKKSQTSAGGAGSKKQQLAQRISQLIAADRAGLFKRPPASGEDEQYRDQELQIAQEDIVAVPVEPILHARYVQIYKASAKRYGFQKDWYVLAAVGKVESNHGQNMGPSSAGAMGPMQFLPSTWRKFGIDGNGDGVANIMDPEDAIPAAARYLKTSGAPKDWTEALYTYNRSGSYVKKVLGIAEAYRRQAGDDDEEAKLYTSS